MNEPMDWRDASSRQVTRWHMWFGSFAVLCLLSAGCRQGDLLRQVKGFPSDKRSAARAESWGFNSEDSTTNLQAALDSGVKKLVVSRQTGPWLVKSTLKLPSNMEIEFEDGAEIKALPGAFKRNTDMLMKAQHCTNLTLHGKGFVTMLKSEYQQNPKLYLPGEHRHTLGLFGCESVRIEGLTLRSSGGDGIYVNRVKNLVIENVVLDDHHRQGISVINAENLLLRNSLIKNTKGTAPECGIDFEPNGPEERLVNCRVENCRFENNAESGINVSLVLTSKSTPVDIVVENCDFQGGRYGISFAHLRRQGDLAGGKIVYRNCRITAPTFTSIYLDTVRSCGPQIELDNVVAAQSSAVAPIYFYLRKSIADKAGHLNAVNCRFDATNASAVIDCVNLSNGAGALEKISGRVLFNGNAVELSEFVASREWDRTPPVLQVKKVEPGVLRPAGFPAVPGQKRAPLTARGSADMFLYAQAGKEVVLTLEYLRLGAYPTPSLELGLMAPGGTNIALGLLEYRAKQAQEFRFTPRQNGGHLLKLAAGVNCIAVRGCSVPWGLWSTPKAHTGNLFGPNGTLYFSVPAGVGSFTIEVAGSGDSKLDAEIRIDGIAVAAAGNIVRSKYFTVETTPAAKPRLGSLTLRNAGLVFVMFPDPLLPIYGNSPENVFVTQGDSNNPAK